MEKLHLNCFGIVINFDKNNISAASLTSNLKEMMSDDTSQ